MIVGGCWWLVIAVGQRLRLFHCLDVVVVVVVAVVVAKKQTSSKSLLQWLRVEDQKAIVGTTCKATVVLVESNE
jgi:transcriptional regulator GlxA family with amidase domain